MYRMFVEDERELKGHSWWLFKIYDYSGFHYDVYDDNTFLYSLSINDIKSDNIDVITREELNRLSRIIQ